MVEVGVFLLSRYIFTSASLLWHFTCFVCLDLVFLRLSVKNLVFRTNFFFLSLSLGSPHWLLEENKGHISGSPLDTDSTYFRIPPGPHLPRNP